MTLVVCQHHSATTEGKGWCAIDEPRTGAEVTDRYCLAECRKFAGPAAVKFVALGVLDGTRTSDDFDSARRDWDRVSRRGDGGVRVNNQPGNAAKADAGADRESQANHSDLTGGYDCRCAGKRRAKVASAKPAFDRVRVITLSRRGDRWAGFQQRLLEIAGGWPFVATERQTAVDGHACLPPPWFHAGKGAWGCYRSHLRAIEDAIQDGVESLLLLEDDAEFIPGFATAAPEFMRRVPADWDIVYFGGQHLLPPHQIAGLPGVVRCVNVNRTHAWAISRRAMVEVYRFLNATPRWASEAPGDHIDYRLGRLTQEGKLKVYAPADWLVIQGAGKSDVSLRQLEARSWSPKPERVMPPLVAVVGPFRSGTSAVAGMLEALGVNFGDPYRPGDQANPDGYREDRRLRQALLELVTEPDLRRKVDREAIIARLRQWLRNSPRGGTVGAKHPLLCAVSEEAAAAWPAAKFIVVERPPEESIASLRRLGWWPEKAEALTKNLRDGAAKLIAAASGRVRRVSYRELLDDPLVVASDLAKFCGLDEGLVEVAAATVRATATSVSPVAPRTISR